LEARKAGTSAFYCSRTKGRDPTRNPLHPDAPMNSGNANENFVSDE
jgi:hypothetical protein